MSRTDPMESSYESLKALTCPSTLMIYLKVDCSSGDMKGTRSKSSSLGLMVCR